MGTLPVSISVPEQSFSTLKHFKTFFRNKTGQKRLIDLALMSIHQDINIDVEEIVYEFSKNNRKIK